MSYTHTLGSITWRFDDLRTLLARASPARSGDELAGLAASTAEERVAAQMALADLPLREFSSRLLIPYESDEVTRLIVDNLDTAALQTIGHLTVGEFRDWLLSDQTTPEALTRIAAGLMPEMAAAVSKIMRVQDLIAVASKIHVVTRFHTTVGLPGRLSTRLQPNHPADDPTGIAASILDGLSLSSGDAVIGINPVSDSVDSVCALLRLVDRIRTTLRLPRKAASSPTSRRRWRRCGAALLSIWFSSRSQERRPPIRHSA